MSDTLILKSVEELRQEWDRVRLAIATNQPYEIRLEIPPELASDPEVKRIIEEIKSTDSSRIKTTGG